MRLIGVIWPFPRGCPAILYFPIHPPPPPPPTSLALTQSSRNEYSMLWTELETSVWTPRCLHAYVDKLPAFDDFQTCEILYFIQTSEIENEKVAFNVPLTFSLKSYPYRMVFFKIRSTTYIFLLLILVTYTRLTSSLNSRRPSLWVVVGTFVGGWDCFMGATNADNLRYGAAVFVSRRTRAWSVASLLSNTTVYRSCLVFFSNFFSSLLRFVETKMGPLNRSWLRLSENPDHHPLKTNRPSRRCIWRNRI